MATTPVNLCAYMRLRQIMAVVPFSAATVWRKVRDGSFPAPVKLSERVTAWKVAEVQAWLDAPAVPATAATNQPVPIANVTIAATAAKATTKAKRARAASASA